MKQGYFGHFLIGKFGLGISYSNRPDVEVDYFYSENDLGVTFFNYTAEPQTPNAQLWATGPT